MTRRALLSLPFIAPIANALGVKPASVVSNRSLATDSMAEFYVQALEAYCEHYPYPLEIYNIQSPEPPRLVSKQSIMFFRRGPDGELIEVPLDK